MKVIVTGASGMIGSALAQSLSAAGHDVRPLVRGRDWDPVAKTIDAAVFSDADAVVHLAGENIASSRWTDAQKNRIRGSRVKGTLLISDTVASAARKPQVLVVASAVGYYGDRGSESLDESSPPGNNFLAHACVDWEKASTSAADAGVRVVKLRFGVVLSPKGGALKKMLTPFKLGAGGVIGSGNQYMPWVTLDEVVRIIQFAVDTPTLAGPVNVVTPDPPTNRQYTKALGAALGRPTIFPMPAFAARLAFGEMADELLLASCRAQPRRLLDAGYTFTEKDLDPALRKMLSH